MARVLFTSVCRPLGPRHGDARSVGYELLLGQVTRAQGAFSPRATHLQFGLDYIAENLDAPTTVLHYPSKEELTRELRRGYDVVGISFLLATFHRMKEVVALVREHAPRARIVLGGYGTALPDEMLKPFGDEICREEGVAFMRRLLGEPEVSMPYRHPLIVSRLRVFGMPVSRTGMVFGGLGCPSGCDFCSTSHFFKRKHVRLLPTGADLYRVVDRYLAISPDISLVILDEDFLLNRKRALDFRDRVVANGRALSIFAFASIRAISKYTMTEILEMGIDGLWIGYEGTRSGYLKQAGRAPEDVFRELRDHGITVLASMIVGFPYQNPDIIEQELTGLLALRPALTQFMIYSPIRGTPFFDQVMAEGKMQPALAADPELYCRKASGFHALCAHPTMSGDEIEGQQDRCFREDFRRLGPSIYRSVETWLLGYLKMKDSLLPILRAKADRLRREIRNAYPVFRAGKLLGPTRVVRGWIADLERRIHAEIGKPTIKEWVLSWVTVALAAATAVKLKLHIFQHPRLTRNTYRDPSSPAALESPILAPRQIPA